MNNHSIDLSGALKRVDGDYALLRLLAKSFLKSGPQMAERMSGAVSAKDLKKVATTAHTLKGTAALFDAHALVETARRMEAAALAGHWENIAAEFELMRSEFALVETALQDILNIPVLTN